MKKLYILLILIFPITLSFSQHWEAANLIGGPQNEEVGNIGMDNDGYLYVTGIFSGESYIGNDTLQAHGIRDIFLAKYNNVNDPIWVKQIMGPNVNNLLFSNIIGFDNANNVYIAGYFFGEITLGNTTFISGGGTDIFIAKFSSNGDHIWSRHEGSSKYEGVTSGSVDNSGNIVLAGYFYDFITLGNYLLFGAGSRDIFLVKYNNMGNIMWAKAEGGNSIDNVTDMTTGPGNNIYLSGYFSASTTFRDTTIYSNGGVDIFLVKYNPFGNLVWARQAGGSSNEYAESISVDDDYNVNICGYFNNTVTFDSITLYSNGMEDIFVAKFNTDGNVLWATKAGSSDIDKCKSIAVDQFNNSYITGYNNGDISFGNTTLIHQGGKDAFLAIIDKNGEFIAAKQMAGVDIEFGKDITLDVDGKIFVSGDFNCPSIHFDTISLNNVDNYDIFIAELSTSSYISCIADFTFLYDSIDLQFEFTDLSEGEIFKWYWDFGDGDTSDLQNPSHVYDDYGTYNVCLAITAINPFSSIYCTDTICKQVAYGKPNTYNLGGQVFAGTYPLDDGIAYLYRILSNNYIFPAETCLFDTLGYYYFYQIDEGNYLVKVDPEFHSSSFKQYIPAYYGNQANWGNGNIINLNQNNYSVDIDLIRAQSYNSGQGKIPGNIRFLKDKPSRDKGPAVGIEILLMDESNNILTLTYSDQYGNFDFSNLAWGTYKIYAEMTGIYTNTITITLDADNPVCPDINLIISNHEIIIGLEEDHTNSITYSGNIYPNPAMDIANIEIYFSKPTDIRFEIYNRLGQLLQFKQQAFFSGKYIIPIKLSELPTGMYFLKITSDDGSSFVRKFVKSKA